MSKETAQQYIDDNIKTNGTQAITGSVMNTALTNIVEAITKEDVGLGNVPNVDATDPDNIGQDSTHRFVTDAQISDWDSKQSVGEKDGTNGYAGLTLLKINFKNVLNTFTSFLTNSNTDSRTYTFQDKDGTIADTVDVATAQAAAEAYADSLVVGLWDDRGNFSAAGGAYPSTGGSGTAGAILKGDIWTISVAGTLPTGQVVEVGDTVRALIDTPGNTQANWAIAQNNIGYVPENAANKATTMSGNTTSNIVYLTAKAIYDWATGLFVQTGSDASVKSLNVTGTNGDGHVHLKHQASDAAATGSSTVVFADSNGDVKTKNDGGFYSTHKTSANSADRVYTYPNETLTLAGITQSITNGDTTKAPSGDVVFDALATKAETFKGQRFTAGPVTEVAGTTVYRISTALSAINMLAIDSNVLADARVLYVINEDGTNTINVSAPSIEFNGGGVGNPYTIAAAAGEMAMFMFDGTAQSNVFVKTL